MGAARIDGAPVDTFQANVAVDEVEKKAPPINADTAPAIRLLETVGEEKNICSGAIEFFFPPRWGQQSLWWYVSIWSSNANTCPRHLLLKSILIFTMEFTNIHTYFPIQKIKLSPVDFTINLHLIPQSSLQVHHAGNQSGPTHSHQVQHQ